MKRDMELIRSICLKAELVTPMQPVYLDAMDGFSTEETLYNAELAVEHGLINGKRLGRLGFALTGLTWDGHDFVEAARQDSIWKDAVDYVKNTSGVMTIEALKISLKIVVAHLTGVPS